MTPIHWVVLSLCAAGLVYIATAVGYHFIQRPGMVVAFIGYVIANCGLIWDAIRSGPVGTL